MNLSKQEIFLMSQSSLTQNQINSFKWGNTPTEETLLRASVIRANEIMEAQWWEDGYQRVNDELVKYVNSCKDAKELDEKNMSYA